jgi:membrane protease YdiL (CAAX protease family)
MRATYLSRGAQWLALCALSEVTAVAVVAASRVGGPAGMNLEAALFAALLLGGTALLWRPRAPASPAPARPWRVVAVAVLSVPIVAIDLRLSSLRIVSSISGEPYTLPGLAQVLVLGPIAEEVIYRGLLWRALIRRGACLTTTLALSTAAFGLYHLAYWSERFTVASMQHLASAVAAGIGFGLLRHWSGGIGLPAVAHAAANSVLLMRAGP